MKLRPYQERLLKEVKEAFNRNNRVLLYALCGCGKTVIALTLIRELIKQGKRVAVSCYSMKDIRKQWRDEIKSNFPDLWEELQIVCSTQDVPDYIAKGIPAVSNGNVSRTKLLTIFIPQSIKDANMGKFDMIVIDEAHERLEVERADGKMGQLKTIIKNHSKPITKYLGLTGTGFKLMGKGKFFEKGTSIIYDLVEGLTDGAINNCALRGEYFDFKLPNSCYKPDNELNSSGIKKFKKFFKTLNKHGKNLMKHKSFATAKLEKLVSEVKGKTLVIIPPGTGYEEAIANFICVLKGPMAAVINISKLGDDLCETNEKLFCSRESRTNFMVIIAKCSTGWDFPGLYNVIDLTFTRNPTSMIQRLARTIRPEDGKPTSQYIYCTDQTRSKKRVIYDLTYALRLTTESGIIACNGGEADAGIPEVMLRKLCRKSGEKKESIEPITFDDYVSCTRHTLMLKSLEQVKREEKEGPWSRLWKPVLRELQRQDKADPWALTEKFRRLVQEFYFEKKQSVESILEKMRNKFPKIYNTVFKNKPIKIVIKEYYADCS